MRRIVLAGYLIAIHGLLGVALLKSDLIPKIEGKLIDKGFMHPGAPAYNFFLSHLRWIHKQMDLSVPLGSTIFLGDSITMALATAAVEPKSVNWGISGQFSSQLLDSIETYSALKHARRVVIMIGVNDLLYGQESGIASRYKKMLDSIPDGTPVVLSSVTPVTEIKRFGITVRGDLVRSVVSSAKAACQSDSRCEFFDAFEALTNKNNGEPLPDVLQNDGIHLAPKGYQLWVRGVQSAISDQDKKLNRN